MRLPITFAILLACLAPASGATLPDDKKPPAGLDASILASLKWRSIGPALTGGRIADFAVVESDPDVVYVASATGGCWKTTNRGTTWEPVFQNGGTASLGDVTVAPSNPNVVWVGTGEAWPWRSVSWGDGVYKSEDGGKTWQHMGLKDSRHVGRILIHPKDPAIVYVAAHGALWGANEERGVFKTTDGGKTWSKMLFISKYTGVSDIEMDPRDPEVLYATAFQRERRNWSFVAGGPEGGIWKTTDGGKTWQQLKTGLPSGEVGRIGLSVCRSQPDRVYAAIQAKGKETGVYRSDDRGASWEHRGLAEPAAKIYCDPNEPERVYFLRNGDSVSEDGGKTFARNFVQRNVHVDLQALWIDPADEDHLLLGNDGGVYFSYDRGRNWEFMPHLPIAQFYTVTVDLQEPFYYVYGGTQDNNSFGGPSGTRNTDGITNADWFMTVGGDGFYVQVDPADPTIVYTESQYGRLVRFDTRTGERRLIQPQPPEGEKYRWNWSSPVLISPHDPKTVYFAANRVFKTGNRGDTWQTVSADLTRRLDQYELPLQGKSQPRDAIQLHQGTADYGNISTIAESTLKPGLLAAGTDDGVVSVSRDGGGTWTRLEKFPGVPNQTYVSRVRWSASSEGTLYATFDGHRDQNFAPYVLKSADYGASWTSITANLPEGSTHVIVEHPRNPRLLFVGTEFGAFFSINGGGSWTELKNNLPTVPVHDMVIHPRENDLVLGTHGRGFWILDDIRPLEELSEEALAADSRLFTPRAGLQLHRFNRGRGFLGQHHFMASNPPDGAIIGYYVKPEVAASAKPPTIQLDVLDQDGKLVRRLDPKQAKEGGGIQRVVWDLRHPLPYAIQPDEDTSFFFGSPRGPFVLPGEYRVRLKVGEAEQVKSVTVKADPMIPLSAADRKTLHDSLISLMGLQGTVRATLQTMDQIQSHVKSIQDAVGAAPAAPPALTAQVQAVADEMTDISRKMKGDPGRSRAEQPGALPISDQVTQLYFQIEGSTALPTDDQKRLLKWSQDGLSAQVGRLNRVVNEDLPKLNRSLDDGGVRWTPGRPIVLPRVTTVP